MVMRDIESPLSELHMIKARIVAARHNAIDLFTDAKEEKDVYLEELLNCFISVVQYPLNFAIYNENDKLLFHFLNDKKYQKKYDKVLKKKEYSKNAFFFFEDFFEEKRYKILVLHMSTKNEITGHGVECQPIDLNDIDQATTDGTSINLKKYLTYCTYLFFKAPWICFETHFSLHARTALVEAIETLAANAQVSNSKKLRNGWPPNNQTIKNSLKKIDLPDEDGIDSWHKKLRELYQPMLRDSKFGLNCQHKLMIERNHSEIVNDDNDLSRMLFSYRTFSREPSDQRHNIDGKGYLYDTRFLIPEKNSITTFFDNFRKRYALSPKGRERYRNECGKTYSEIVPEKNMQYDIHLYLIMEIDKLYWSTIASVGGVSECVKSLQSPVGDNTRSMVDPVYHTGLIHTNMLFENGGLDRVSGIPDNINKKQMDKYIDDNTPDLLRIVTLYYLFSEMAGCRHIKEKGVSANLAAVLMPIKMRGSVWAVTLHPMYLHQYDTNFLDDNYWNSYYHLTTGVRRKNQHLIDWILWENVLQRISELLIKYIGRAKSETFAEAIDAVDALLKGEQCLVPYSLPTFSLNMSSGMVPNNIIEITSPSNKSFQIYWHIVDNEFFQAQQKWSKNSTRTPQQAIELGVSKGIQQLKYNIISEFL